jgi:hypothetical protein
VDLSHVLWIGGGPESERSAVARALAERFSLRAYSVDEHDAAHALRMPALVADDTVEGVLTASRHRFRLVLEDLTALPPGPDVIVEGPQLFPTSVAAVLRELAHALFLLPVVADDPIVRRIAWEARDLRLATLAVDAPLEEIVERAAAHFLPVISAAADTSL